MRYCKAGIFMLGIREHWVFTGLGRRHDDTKLSGVCLYGYRFNVIFSQCYDARDISRDVLDFSCHTVDRHRFNLEQMVAQLHVAYRVYLGNVSHCKYSRR